jgi:hypothetical protein
MYPDFKEVLEELSYKVGIVDLTKESHKQILVKLLRERNVDSAQQLVDRASVVFEYIKEYTSKLKRVIKEDEVVKGKDSGNVYTVKTFNPDKHDKPTPAEIEKAKASNGGELPSADKPTSKQQTPPTSGQKLSGSDFASSAEKGAEPTPSKPKKRIINGKDKTLSSENPLETKEFEKDLEPNDEDFAEKNKKFANPIPPPPFKVPESIAQNPKFPKRYLKLLERMMNTQPVGAAKKISHFSDFPGGAGKLPAQAGELMTMMACTMTDDEWNEMQSAISDHTKELISQNPELKKDGTRIVNQTWLKAATNNRKAILKKIEKLYPGHKIAAASWDTKNEVESLGLGSYSDKGFSTDIYIRLENEKGEPLLEEISLKQNLKVNLLNSGTGKFFEWVGKENIPDDINPQMFAKNQREKLGKFCEANADAIRKLAEEDEDFKKAMEEKGIDFDTALSDTLKGKGSREKNKVLFEGIKALQNKGDAEASAAATDFINDSDNDHKSYVEAAVSAITTNAELKEGMLNEVKNEFPLKSVADGEESIALGEYMLDKSTMEVIFGTSDFEEFKEGLISQAGPPPFIAFKVKVGGRVIPIANIDIREDGRNYGGQFKFEMVVNNEFAKEIIKANKQVYP